MLRQWSRYTALLFAIGLAIGEAVINWGDWQYAPLWIVDYVCVAWLLAGFWQTRQGTHLWVLISGWAFTAGVFYMALFVSMEPVISKVITPNSGFLTLLAGMLMLAILGITTGALATRQR